MEDTRTLKAATYCLEGDENITKYVWDYDVTTFRCSTICNSILERIKKVFQSKQFRPSNDYLNDVWSR